MQIKEINDMNWISKLDETKLKIVQQENNW